MYSRQFFCIAAILLASSLAQAQGSVGVIVVGEPTAEAGKFQQALESAFEGSSAGVIGGGAVGKRLGLGRDDPRPKQPDVAAAVDKALKEAEAFYDDVEYTKAQARLDEAQEALNRAPNDWERRRDLHLLRMAVLLGQERETAARNAAERALMVDPRVKVDLDRFLPAMATLLEAERQKNPAVTVKLTDLPAGATVEVDGRPVPAPYDVFVTRGRHRLRISASGYRTLEGTFTWQSNSSFAVPLAVKLGSRSDSALKALIRDGMQYRDSRGIWGEGRGAGIDVLVVGGVSGTSRAPVRRVAVWRLGQTQNEKSIIVRPTDGADPFNVEDIQAWVREKANVALAMKDEVPVLGQGNGQFHTVLPMDRGAFSFDTRLIFAFRSRRVAYEDEQGRDHSWLLSSSGPGFRLTAGYSRPVRKSLLVAGLDYRFMYFSVNPTLTDELGPVDDEVILRRPGGVTNDAVVRLGWSLRFRGGRIGLTPGVGYALAGHYQDRTGNRVPPLDLFTNYIRGSALFSLGYDYALRSATFEMRLDLGPAGLGGVLEFPDQTLGEFAYRYSDARFHTGLGWLIRQQWVLSLAFDAEHFRYSFDVPLDDVYQNAGLDPPADDSDPRVGENNWSLSFALRRIF